MMQNRIEGKERKMMQNMIIGEEERKVMQNMIKGEKERKMIKSKERK